MKKNKFYNVLKLTISFFRSLPMAMTSKKSKKYFGELNPENWFLETVPLEKSKDLIVTWIGHSSFLIQLNNKNILIDPIFEDLMFLYKRNFSPGISLKNLPKIDYILISHDHADHLHRKTLLKLKNYNATIFVPKGAMNWFEKNNFENVYESEWWQNHIIDKNLKFDFLPAAHWSGQSLRDINKSICGSWMISSNNKNIYFAGDSAYGDHYKKIANKYSNIDLALMPIAPCNPRKDVKDSHLDAREAVNAFLDLNAKNFIPMHWGTFRTNLDMFYEPIELLNKSWADLQNVLFDKKLNILKFGESIRF